MPGQPDFAEADLRLKAILRALSLVFPNGIAGLRVADLGSLEGGFALSLAQRGASVLGIEARKLNMEKLLLLKEHFALQNLEFLLGDVKSFSADRFGGFDVVLALGILYHLDSPVAWLNQIGAATRRLLVVDSHFAPADSAALAQIDPRISALSDLEKTEFGGHTYEGRWFTEYSENVDPEPQLWASYSNHRSFWLTKESLTKAILRAGFDLVFEQHDYSAEIYHQLAITFPRTMMIAIKL